MAYYVEHYPGDMVKVGNSWAFAKAVFNVKPGGAVYLYPARKPRIRRVGRAWWCRLDGHVSDVCGATPEQAYYNWAWSMARE